MSVRIVNFEMLSSSFLKDVMEWSSSDLLMPHSCLVVPDLSTVIVVSLCSSQSLCSLHLDCGSEPRALVTLLSSSLLLRARPHTLALPKLTGLL